MTSMNTGLTQPARATTPVMAPLAISGRLPEPTRHAQEAWSKTTLSERLAVIGRFRRRVADAPTPLLEALKGEGHRPAAELISSEMIPLADACRFLERRAAKILASRRLGRTGRPLWLSGSKVEIQREPLGVVLVIGASNYPLLLPGIQVLQSLVAGNAVILKPGRGGGAVARVFAEMLYRAGVDDRLVRVLSEAPEAASQTIAEGVDKVLLTGSAQTGRAVLSQLASHLTPATMELSGCDPVFVRDDADLELVVAAIRFGLSFNGSATCIAPRRLYVSPDMAERLEPALVESLASLGPVNLEDQILERARGLVREALASGARLVTGSAGDVGSFRATVLADVSPGASVLRSDIFAPLLSLVRVESDDEALAHAASCPYALGATVFGEPRGARALAHRVRAGVVVINDMIVPTADPRIAFGGLDQSGFGVTRGPEGLLDLTSQKVVLVRGGRSRPHLQPFKGGEDRLLLGYLQAAHGTGWKRLRAFAEMAKSAKAIQGNSLTKKEEA